LSGMEWNPRRSTYRYITPEEEDRKQGEPFLTGLSYTGGGVPMGERSKTSGGLPPKLPLASETLDQGRKKRGDLLGSEGIPKGECFAPKFDSGLILGEKKPEEDARSA